MESPPAQEREGTKRQVAYKTRVSDLMNNRYVKEEGWLPNYILINSHKVSRANIVGVIVSKQAEEATPSFILDDGTGRIPLRFYKPEDFINVGDIVLVIGRPREFGQDRYLVPEIMKRLKDLKWVEVRKKELMLQMHAAASATAATAREKQEKRPTDEEEDAVDTDDLTADPRSDILTTIRSLDKGGGAEIDEIYSKTRAENTDFWLKKLLESGDIFEVKPGRYKVLE